MRAPYTTDRKGFHKGSRRFPEGFYKGSIRAPYLTGSIIRVR